MNGGVEQTTTTDTALWSRSARRGRRPQQAREQTDVESVVPSLSYQPTLLSAQRFNDALARRSSLR